MSPPTFEGPLRKVADSPLQAKDSGVRKQPVVKSAVACQVCRKRKVKCSGTVPCGYCSKRNLNCILFGHAERRVYSVTHVESLQSKLAEYERVWPARVGEPVLPRSSVPCKSPETVRNQTPSNQISVPRPKSTSKDLDDATTLAGSSIDTDTSLSSSNAFSARVQRLLDHSGSSYQNPSYVSPDGNCSNYQRLRGDIRQNLPTETEAYQLLDTVIFYIGQSQSHFDQREVSNNIDAYYANEDALPLSGSPRFLMMVLLFAIGELFSSDHRENVNSSYSRSLFEYVHERIAVPSEQFAQGRSYVELLALVAVYLQNVNRREEAYIYINSALRLAVAHGYHRQLKGRHVMQWEKTHTNRLWWTIYMQERRLAAATGLPFGISDEFVEAEYPCEAPGFNSSAPIRTNIKIARITSRILTGVYMPKPRTQRDFILNVQEILRSLYDISHEIPADAARTSNGVVRDVSIRTNASLQLMLYEATLLTIRPIMLHVAGLVLKGQKPSSEDLRTTSLGQLSRTCVEAARRLLHVVSTLKKREMLAVFGFFDCDAIFSAAFVMILAVIFDSACSEEDKINPSPGLQDALDDLQYLADHNNMSAVERLRDINEVCSNLSAHIQVGNADTVPPAPSSPPRAPSEANQQSQYEMQGSRGNEKISDITERCPETPSANPKQQLAQSNLQPIMMDMSSCPNPNVTSPRNVWDSVFQMPICPPDEQNTVHGEEMPPMNLQVDQYFEHFQSLLNGTEWTLTGHDAGDFAELGRYIENYTV